MTARSTRPESIAIMAKRRDTTPAKPNAKRRDSEGAAVRKYKDTSNFANAELIDPDKPLTEKQMLFVKNWAAGDSITAASSRAGYNDGASMAYRMVKMPNILRVYEAEKLKYEEASQMTRKRVMDGLLEGIELAKLMAEPASVIGGWREIGKMCGYYEPVKRRVEVSVNGNVVLERMNQMSDADLLRLVTSVPGETLTDAITDAALSPDDPDTPNGE